MNRNKKSLDSSEFEEISVMILILKKFFWIDRVNIPIVYVFLRIP